MANHLCGLCQVSYDDFDAFDQHLKAVSPHNKCKRCRKGFKDLGSYQQHVSSSPFHESTRHTVLVSHDAPLAPLAIPTTPPLPSQEHLDRQLDFYKGEDSTDVNRVVYTAKTNLHKDCTPEEIAEAAESSLSLHIVSLIMKALRRSFHEDLTASGIRKRRQSETFVASIAKTSEQSLIDQLRAIWPGLLDQDQLSRMYNEAELRGERLLRLTPDILFAKPVLLFGKPCHWIEYKASFGFIKAPYVSARNKTQYEKYAQHLGPGIVCYKHGFEEGLLDIEGVMVKREREVVLHLLQGLAAGQPLVATGRSYTFTSMAILAILAAIWTIYLALELAAQDTA